MEGGESGCNRWMAQQERIGERETGTEDLYSSSSSSSGSMEQSGAVMLANSSGYQGAAGAATAVVVVVETNFLLVEWDRICGRHVL